MEVILNSLILSTQCPDTQKRVCTYIRYKEVFNLSNSHDKGYVSLFFYGILAAYAILGLLVFVPGLLVNPTILVLIGVVLVVIIVLVFAIAIILKGLSKLFHKF